MKEINNGIYNISISAIYGEVMLYYEIVANETPKKRTNNLLYWKRNEKEKKSQPIYLKSWFRFYCKKKLVPIYRYGNLASEGICTSLTGDEIRMALVNGTVTPATPTQHSTNDDEDDDDDKQQPTTDAYRRTEKNQ